MHEIEVQGKVVCFLQPIFTDELKREEAGDKRFSLTVSDQAGPEKRVAFKVFKVKMRIKLNNLKGLVHKLDLIVILQNISQL